MVVTVVDAIQCRILQSRGLCLSPIRGLSRPLPTRGGALSSAEGLFFRHKLIWQSPGVFVFMHRLTRGGLPIAENAWRHRCFSSEGAAATVRGRSRLSTSAEPASAVSEGFQGSGAGSPQAQVVKSTKPGASGDTGWWHAALQRAFQRESREWFLQRKQGTLWHIWDPPGIVFSLTKYVCFLPANVPTEKFWSPMCLGSAPPA